MRLFLLNVLLGALVMCYVVGFMILFHGKHSTMVFLSDSWTYEESRYENKDQHFTHANEDETTEDASLTEGEISLEEFVDVRNEAQNHINNEVTTESDDEANRGTSESMEELPVREIDGSDDKVTETGNANDIRSSETLQGGLVKEEDIELSETDKDAGNGEDIRTKDSKTTSESMPDIHRKEDENLSNSNKEMTEVEGVRDQTKEKKNPKSSENELTEIEKVEKIKAEKRAGGNKTTESLTEIQKTAEEEVVQTTTESQNFSTEKRTTTKEAKQCKPVENVVFLKTHKTGSSTVLNVFQRYSEHHKLLMALPRVNNRTHLLKWPNLFQESFVFEHEPGRKYNLLANHARYSRKDMLKVMKNAENTKFVTILREPLLQFESMFSYFKLNKSLRMDHVKTAHDFLREIENDRTQIVARMRKGGWKSVLTLLSKNPNAFDLGFDPWEEKFKDISRIIATVEKDFNLVMISDYMLESLVLLKDELCWELEDVVYFTLNKRPDKYRHNFNDITRERKIMSTWSRIDFALYEHFNRTFWEKIKSKGDRFQNDVKKLREMNKELDEKCIDHGTHLDKAQPWFPILGYKIKEEAKDTDYYELCKQITRTEVYYTFLLGQKQSRKGFKMSKGMLEKMNSD